MMFPFMPDRASYDYLRREYSQFMHSSSQISTHMTQLYWQAWSEMLFSPPTFIRRNLAYLGEAYQPPRPAWQTPHSEIGVPKKFASIIKLLDFSEPTPKAVVPTLVLPPQAGHHSYIADYSPEQSQVKTLRDNGLNPIYCIEWLSATPATAHKTIEDYIEAVHWAVARVGGKVNLVGDCQGGWLAAIYAAMYPDTLNTLVVAGAPIDFQAGDGQIKQSVNYISKTYPENGMSYYKNLINLGNGVMDGRLMLMGFNMLKPDQYPERFLQLYQDVLKPKAVKRFREITNWYDYPQSISGAFYLWLVAHLFRDNALIKDELFVAGRRVSLKNITCPLFLLAGIRDHITPPVQVFEMANYVGTPPEQIEKILEDAGHIGLFMGHEVLAKHWSAVGRKISEFSEL
jgi:poly(3-hydroxybutyrate) depolymerase